MRVLDPLFDFQYQSKHRNRPERWPLTGRRSLRVRARGLTSPAVIAAVEPVVVRWARLSPKVSLVMVDYDEKLARADRQYYYSNNFQLDHYWLAGTGTPEVFELKFSYKQGYVPFLRAALCFPYAPARY